MEGNKEKITRFRKTVGIMKIIFVISIIGMISYGVWYYWIFMTPHCQGWGDGGYVCDQWASKEEKYKFCLGQSIIDIDTGKRTLMTPYDCNVEVYDKYPDAKITTSSNNKTVGKLVWMGFRINGRLVP